MTNLGATPERLSRAYRRSYATTRSATAPSGMGKLIGAFQAAGGATASPVTAR